MRYLNIHEDDQLDEAQLAAWVKQASQLPGWGKAQQIIQADTPSRRA